MSKVDQQKAKSDISQSKEMQGFQFPDFNNLNVTQMVQDKLKTTKNIIEQKLDTLQNDLKQSLVVIDNSLKSSILSKKKEFNVWIRKRVEKAVMELMQKSRPIVKESLKDPEMCDCVKSWVDEGVDQTWPIVVEQFQQALHNQLHEQYIEVQQSKQNILCLPCNFIRTKYLYATQPYDKTFWYSIKTFWYWFFTIISAFPQYGVQPLFYIFIFLCIDKRDEYQLTQYILDFKKMQFITQGCINAIIGYVLYYQCLSLNENPLTIYQECYEKGPGSQINYLYDLIVFLIQVGLVWFAYILLPCSQKKGRTKLKYDDENNQLIEDEQNSQCLFNCSRGGALQCVMIFELINIGICVAIFILSMNKMKPYQNFSSLSDYALKPNPYLYFAWIVYGLLSFPFLIFALGPLGKILTKSLPTGYDKYGNTVPLKSNVNIQYQQSEELNNILNIDIEEMIL